MKTRLNALKNLMQKRDKSYLSFLLLSVFIFFQSLLFIPATGQNGISISQSAPNRTELSNKRNLNKQSTFSFLKIFFQLNNPFQYSDQHQLVWTLSQYIYSQKVDQSFSFLKYSDHLRPCISGQNIFHSNLDENFFLQA